MSIIIDRRLILTLTFCFVGIGSLMAEDVTPSSSSNDRQEATAKNQQTYSDGFIPEPPAPLPAIYKDYQILPFSFSPDSRYGFIYPKRSIIYKTKNPHLFLAALKPFRVLADLPLHSSLTENSQGYYAANWAADSTAVAIIEGIKWGPSKVYLIPIHNGKAGEITDLTVKVRKEVFSDYKKSKISPYNDYFDFVFDNQDRAVENQDGEILSEKGWDPDTHGQVAIDCICTTEPRPDMGIDVWTVRFEGVWNIAKKRFMQKAFTRIPPRHND